MAAAQGRSPGATKGADGGGGIPLETKMLVPVLALLAVLSLFPFFYIIWMSLNIVSLINGTPFSPAVAVRRDVRGEQIAHLQAEGLDDLLSGAARAAEEEDTAILSLLDVEVRGSLVVVCGAEGPVEAVLGSYAFQVGEERLDGPRWRAHDDL